jgi:hypothetical protein
MEMLFLSVGKMNIIVKGNHVIREDNDDIEKALFYIFMFLSVCTTLCYIGDTGNFLAVFFPVIQMVAIVSIVFYISFITMIVGEMVSKVLEFIF